LTPPKESDLRQQNITELAQSTRDVWAGFKSNVSQNDLSPEAREQFEALETHMKVISDPNYVRQQIQAGSRT
jgi:hypothetical protein